MKVAALKAYEVFKTISGEKDAEVVFEYKVNEKQAGRLFKGF